VAENFSAKPYAQEYKKIFLEELQIFFTTNRAVSAAAAAIQSRWNEVNQ